MAYASDADLTARIPATEAVDVAVRALALADAAEMIDDTMFAGRTVRAQCFLAAHYLALNPDSGMPSGGEGGIVSARSAGAISVSYAVPTIPAGWDPSLASTSYGRQFLQIASTVASAPVVA